MSKITKQQLQSYLWESANILRGKISSEKVNYNNRDFLNLNHKAFRRSNKNNSPVMMSSFITYYKEYVYFIQFVSYQFNSTKNWEIEIEKSMSNLFINKFITKKD